MTDREKLNALELELVQLKAEIEALKRSNPLWGKKYYACGDSFTEGDFSGYTAPDGFRKEESPFLYDAELGMYKTYPWQIAKRNNMTLINEALRGSTLALSREYIALREKTGEERPDTKLLSNLYRPFALERYTRIPADTDYCTLWFGINDSVHTELGQPGDTAPDTFYGAWDTVFRWILTNRPRMKTGAIVSNDCPASYREATIASAKRWGIPYLDLMGDDSVPMITSRDEALGVCADAVKLRSDFFYVSAGNDHPNLAAHEYESTVIEHFLRTL